MARMTRPKRRKTRKKEAAGVKGPIDARLRELSWGYRPALLILTANRLRLFDALSDRPVSARGLARKLELDRRALVIILDALTALGLLIKQKDAYRCRTDVKELLVTDGARFKGNILDHRFNVLERWMDLPRVVKQGGPAKLMRSRRSPREWREFILGMEDVARESIDPFLEAMNLEGRRRLIDLGGGPGTYTIALCRRYRELEAILYDLPETVAIARKQILEAGLDGRIETAAGDYMNDDIGRGFDAALLSNIIHSLSGKEFLMLARKVFRALDEGGIIVVREFRLDENRTSPTGSALFAVNMLVSTDGGNCYTPSEIKKTLGRAGFERFRILPVNPQANIYIGTKTTRRKRSKT
jgi:SAM-dependent methyltransferase/biotin operon repressor